MKIRNLALSMVVLALTLSPHDAQARRWHHTPHRARHHHHIAGVDRSAGYSDIVIDAETGRVLHETDGDALRHPASLTKMMTLYITFQALESGRLRLDQHMTVSQNAADKEPTKLGLRAGRRIRVEDAILGIVTESANDAAVVLGETLGGSEAGFARLMTKQARALGMTRTLFRNPSGLPDSEQVTTAHDMAILAAALINHYPEFYHYFSCRGFTYAGIYRHGHNHLMDRYYGMDGMKTGYIRASGFNLVASARHGDTRLIGVVFGGRSAVSRDNKMARLLDQSFDVARAESRSPRMVAAVIGEGDGVEADSGDYIPLPAKRPVVFPSREYAGLQSGEQVDDQVNDSPEPQPASAPQYAARRRALAPKSGNKWGVQIGAYSDAAIGQQALSSLASSMPGLLADAEPQVQKVSVGGAIMYRARLMALDRKTAQNVCSYLIQRSKSCLTVEP